jgi:hypothetical protein
VITLGHVPFVTVLMFVTVNPGSQQVEYAIGVSNCHAVLHWTVLLDTHVKVRLVTVGGITTNGTVQVVDAWFVSITVI